MPEIGRRAAGRPHDHDLAGVRPGRPRGNRRGFWPPARWAAKGSKPGRLEQLRGEVRPAARGDHDLHVARPQHGRRSHVDRQVPGQVAREDEPRVEQPLDRDREPSIGLRESALSRTPPSGVVNSAPTPALGGLGDHFRARPASPAPAAATRTSTTRASTQLLSPGAPDVVASALSLSTTSPSDVLVRSPHRLVDGHKLGQVVAPPPPDALRQLAA